MSIKDDQMLNVWPFKDDVVKHYPMCQLLVGWNYYQKNKLHTFEKFRDLFGLKKKKFISYYKILLVPYPKKKYLTL